MATIKDLAEQYGLEDYEQLLGGYPNAEKFITGLKDAAVRSVPTTEQMRDPNFIIDTAGFGGAIKAYHGTPHLFDRFDMSKIGTGEGAQAYGHGLYLAQDPSIAESYRQNLTANSATLNDKKFDDIVDELDKSAFDYTRTYGSKEKALDALNSKIKDASKFDDVDWLNIVKHRLENSKFEKPQGNIYETSIQWPNAEREAMDPLGEHHLLDWNQPAEGYVQEAIPRKIRELQNARDAISSKYVDDEFNPDDLFSNIYSFPSKEDKAAMDRIAEEIVMHKNMSPAFEKGAEGSVTYSKLVKMLGSPEKASEYLHSLDIPGIKYLDATSRSTDKGTRNFVTFGDEYPQIVKRAGSLDELQEKNLNKRLIEKYLSEGKLSPDDMAQYEQNALAMETPLLQRYNVKNALANPNREAYKNEFDDQDYYHGTSHDFKSFKPSEYGRLNEGVYVTPDKKVASMFSKISGSKRSGESANTMPLKINPKNVYTYENYGDIPLTGTNNEYFKQKGIDALAVKDKEMALFDPSMIRSRFAAFDPLRKNSSSIMASGLLGDLALKYANDEDQGYAQGGIVDKLKSQDFGPDDSVIVSSLMHPSEAAGKAGDWLQEKMRIASGRPYEDNFTPDQQAQAGLDLAGLMQTGAMPFAPESAGGTLGTLHKFRIGDLGYDLRFDDRKLEQDKLQNMVLQLSRPENEKRIISLANYEGYPWVTSMSDRTNVGNLHYINDRPVDVDLQGGQDYMFNNPGQVWASAQAPVNAIMKYGRELSERAGGLDPLYMPWRMAPTGGDYANMTGETMLKYMRSNMNKKEQRAVNKGIKDFIPDFKGIESEEGIDQFRNAPDKVRKALKNHLDTKYRNAGGISIGEARLAVADPSQLLAPDTGLQNVGQIYIGNPIIQESGHRAYPRGVPGQGLGVLDRDVMAYDLMPEVAEYRGLIDLKNPRTTDIRALQMKPYGGIITDKILKNLGYAKGGEVSMDDLPFNDPDQLRLYHQAMQHFDDVIENTGASKKTGKGTARVNYSTLTKGDIDKENALHTLMANYGVDIGDLNLDAGLIKPMEADGLYIGDLTGSLPLGEGRASLGVQGMHSKYDDGLSGYTAGYNGKVGDGNISARYFEPADHNSAGRQVQLEYALPFAKGGEVKDLHKKYEESDYGYGNRPDKTKKGLGYFGELERPDGTGVMTEYSIGVPINGEEMDVPTLVPTLTPDEIRLILHMQDGDDMPRSIVHKAIDHAHQRLSEGKPIFATEEDLYAHGGIVDVLHNDAIEQIMKAFMDSMADDEEPSAPAVSIEITTQNTETPRRGKIPKSIAREAKHG